MSRLLLLDSGPLGLITQPKVSFEVVAVNHWLLRRLRDGDRAVVPAIVYYEIRRELLRAKKQAGLARLEAFVGAEAGRYLHLSDAALLLAAELWAKTRQEGRPTTTPLDLDIDVILAAQALTVGGDAEAVVVTTNVRHLQPFVNAKLWNEVVE